MKHMLILCSCMKNGLFNILVWCMTCVVRASPPPHRQTPLFIKSCSRIAQILLHSGGIDGSFCSGHFNPFKSFFSTMYLESDYYSSRCKDINGLWVFKGALYDVWGWGQWSLNVILF
jgi:hypothetical protein